MKHRWSTYVSVLSLIMSFVAVGFVLLSKPEVNVQGGNTQDAQKAKRMIDVMQFGAVGDGKTNDALAVSQAIAYAEKLSASQFSPESNIVLVFPPAEGYALDTPIQIPPNVSVEQHAPLIYTGDAYEPFVTIGEQGKTTRASYTGLAVIRKKQSAWLSSDPAKQAIGIRIFNATSSFIDIRQADCFTIGSQFIGAGKGFAYNEVRLGQFIGNHIGVELTNQKGKNGRIGWINENLYMGGRFSVRPSLHANEDRIGVVITSQDGTYKNNNNNIFIKPSFELSQSGLVQGAEALPILIEHGKLNTFEYIRNEGNGTYAARIVNGSSDNVISTGMGAARIDDRSLYPSTITSSASERVLEEHSHLLASYNLSERFRMLPDGHISFVGMSFLTDGSNDVLGSVSGQAISRNQDGTFIVKDTALGVMIDTRKVKSFVVKRASPGNSAGRVVIKGYDARGNIVNAKHGGWLKGKEENVPYWSEKRYGGVYITGSDNSDPLFFVVGPEVARVWLGIAPGSGAAVVGGMAIYTKPADYTLVSSGIRNE
ncbi:hypothetical protein SAMN04489735_101319 [Aneurinibacillus thermoaerophilus]|uniref:Pectate lyase superfamily protein n=1 Tax=Aneurinibacillus thermoaerophilus TaxID=143495 RepID=A0A1G7ZY80_ANETH|nr:MULTISPECIES: hypothetical protein [Aneurinibacillus]AMA71682.1 hypothetical protein ACH33_01730 [Aneurinibacillus sp. XH2]SDH13659.1 hypothetical protein SAMN04489735_101319 [Aneurinibacillus thermoaerophilus]